MKIKCLYCNKMSVRMFGMKVHVCAEHYDDFLKEQRGFYAGKLTGEERFMMNKAKEYKLWK